MAHDAEQPLTLRSLQSAAVAGGLGGLAADLFLHPIDMVKTTQQALATPRLSVALRAAAQRGILTGASASALIGLGTSG